MTDQFLLHLFLIQMEKTFNRLHLDHFFSSLHHWKYIHRISISGIYSCLITNKYRQDYCNTLHLTRSLALMHYYSQTHTFSSCSLHAVPQIQGTKGQGTSSNAEGSCARTLFNLWHCLCSHTGQLSSLWTHAQTSLFLFSFFVGCFFYWLFFFLYKEQISNCDCTSFITLLFCIFGEWQGCFLSYLYHSASYKKSEYNIKQTSTHWLFY